jgi:dTDP-4-dehydrorhamnose reductase
VELTGTGNNRPVRAGNWKDARLDVTSPSAVRSFLEERRPRAVFFTSYHTADRSITVDGAVAAARAASQLGARFLFTSTDLVFDGKGSNYHENVPAAPIMPYGQMKLEAEVAVRDACPSAVILRPALMAGESGVMLRPAYECGNLLRGMPVDLYTDEWRSPLHVDDAARACWELISLDVSGTYHLGGPERLTRLELGRIVCTLYQFDAGLLREAKRPDDRPRDVSLDSTRVTTLLGWKPRALSAIATESPLDAALV